MSSILSVNIGAPMEFEHTGADHTGINKQAAVGRVQVSSPGPRGSAATGGSGVAGDTIGDRRFHGGEAQAVYAYAREDLDDWEKELGRTLSDGVFGENLTTGGVEVTGALIGERWRVGEEVVLEVTSCRIPCRTFAAWLEEDGWVKRFTQDARPGAYLRVITPGRLGAGDGVEVVHRPEHDVTVGVLFRALTTEPELLDRTLQAADTLNPRLLHVIQSRLTRA